MARLLRVIEGKIDKLKGGLKMETERDFGYEYAADQGDGPVDIDKMVTGSVDIPEGDYRAMKLAGIENPDARAYWEGYNSYFA